MRRNNVIITSMLTGLLALLFSDFALADAYQKALEQIQKDTGLAPIQIPNTEGAYLGKTHRGYEVIYTAKAGNVWGRYAGRLTMGEIGHEVGGLLGFLTGQREALGAQVVGSPARQGAVENHRTAAGSHDHSQACQACSSATRCGEQVFGPGK